MIPPLAYEVFGAIWVAFGLYMVPAFVMGCPYCGVPDLAWPATIVRGALGR